MTRALWVLGIFLALALILITGWSLTADPPKPHIYQQGAFRCDHSWRLPCDTVSSRGSASGLQHYPLLGGQIE